MQHLKILRNYLEQHGTIKECAKKLDVTASFLGDVLLGKDRLSLILAHKLHKTYPDLDVFKLLEMQLRHEWDDYRKKAKFKQKEK